MFQVREWRHLIGMQGFSNTMLENHFKLYEGYVKATNEILRELEVMRENKQTASKAYSEVRRRLGWELDGMRLHEYYFDNLGGKDRLREDSKLGRKLIESFGSIEAWKQELRATGEMRGIGWAILYQEPTSGDLMDLWVNEHDAGHPAGAAPILVLDVFEHAYMLDYGLKKGEYVEAFLHNVDWQAVEARVR